MGEMAKPKGALLGKIGSLPSFLTISDLGANCIEYGVCVVEDVDVPEANDSVSGC